MHKFKYRSQDSLNPICSFGNDIETSAHFFLSYPNYSNGRSTFLNIIESIDKNILTWRKFSSYPKPFFTATVITAQKMKFSIKDSFSKCDHIRRKLRIWSHLVKKSLMENSIFCAVNSNNITNTLILNAAIDFLIATQRFDVNLL